MITIINLTMNITIMLTISIITVIISGSSAGRPLHILGAGPLVRQEAEAGLKDVPELLAAGRRLREPGVWRVRSCAVVAEVLPKFFAEPATFLNGMTGTYSGDLWRRRIRAKTAQKISKSWLIKFPSQK